MLQELIEAEAAETIGAGRYRRSGEQRIQDILGASGQLADMAARGWSVCDGDWAVSDAADCNLTVIGETLGNPSNEFVARHPDFSVFASFADWVRQSA